MKFSIFILAISLVLAGCTTKSLINENVSMVANDTDNSTMIKENVMVKTYQPFTKSAYLKARSEGKIIFLEFYANWCPSCLAQAPALVNGFASLNDSRIVAFRVDYKDSNTDSDESALAQELGIAYQHTHIVLNPQGEIILRSNDVLSESDVKALIEQVAGG